jgi:hypothetical protein
MGMVLIHMSYVFKVFPTAQSVYHFHFSKTLLEKFFFAVASGSIAGWRDGEERRYSEGGMKEGRKGGREERNLNTFLDANSHFKALEGFKYFFFLLFVDSQKHQT